MAVVASVPGKPLLLGAFDIGSVGYIAEEFFVSGTAASYAPVSELGPDGRWTATPSGAADYATRIVALTPADQTQFNGTVLVEWLNVSGGIDAPAVWMMGHREITRAGYAYVAVSAQQVGVAGGAGLLGVDMSLKRQEPAPINSAPATIRGGRLGVIRTRDHAGGCAVVESGPSTTRFEDSRHGR
ncbi:hypothetical protein MGAST_05965 [Mycobacterium gastri 'Wayne']|uniref:Alpha/beta hydrolase domain-containing protein n=1 Tax=Mycobacterium gastri TaxID=1777 RepID=A0A1X1V524_MYCGS|nr:hypothetical protein MGAST_05965 [Mycobacterium gastri 'Wayne']ORV64131.1 hypothetical protein AWC07_15170 [Mycobacterium gastri]